MKRAASLRLVASLCPVALASAVAWPRAARAEGGRFDSDVALSAEAGGQVGSVAAGTFALRALYIATAGAYAEVAAGKDGYRFGGAGVELRPLFIPRFLKNLEGSRDVFELTIDSLALDVGASTRTNTEAAWLALGIGFEVPFLGRYDGPFLGVRGFRELAPTAFRGAGGGDTRILFTLGFRIAWNAHIVDAGDRSSR